MSILTHMFFANPKVGPGEKFKNPNPPQKKKEKEGKPISPPLSPPPKTDLSPLPVRPNLLLAEKETWIKNFAPKPGRVQSAFAATSAERIRQAEALLRVNGQWPPQDNQIFVIQIDQDSPPPPPERPPIGKRFIGGKLSDEELAWQKAFEAVTKYLTSYTGQTVIFRAQKKGKDMELIELNPKGPYASASHPGQRWVWGFTDFDGNGTSDIAWLRSGVYLYEGKNAGGIFKPVDDKAMLVARDLNQDGVIDAKESSRTQAAHATDIQFHFGSFFSPVSVGCQTLPPVDYIEFRRLLDGLSAERFTYVLVRRPHEIWGESMW